MLKPSKPLAPLILEKLVSLHEYAERDRTCKRKAVGTEVILPFMGELHFISQARNGPTSRQGQDHCNGVKGACGCGHSEPKALLEAHTNICLSGRSFSGKYLLIVTYSPCTFCANTVLSSPIIHAVAYDILTEHDKRGAEILKEAMPVWSKADLMNNGTEIERYFPMY